MAEVDGLRALGVEFEGVMDLLIQGMLEELGYEVAVTVAFLAKSLTAAADDRLILST